jgi:hypothetical protein
LSTNGWPTPATGSLTTVFEFKRTAIMGIFPGLRQKTRGGRDPGRGSGTPGRLLRGFGDGLRGGSDANTSSVDVVACRNYPQFRDKHKMRWARTTDMRRAGRGF